MQLLSVVSFPLKKEGYEGTEFDPRNKGKYSVIYTSVISKLFRRLTPLSIVINVIYHHECKI